MERLGEYIYDFIFYVANFYMAFYTDMDIYHILVFDVELLFGMGLVRYWCRECIREIRKRKETWSRTKNNKISQLVAYGLTEKVKEHINKDNVNSIGIGYSQLYTPLTYALHVGTVDTNMVKFLLDLGADVNFRGSNDFFFPCVQAIHIFEERRIFCREATKLLIRYGLTFETIMKTKIRRLSHFYPWNYRLENMAMYFRLLPFLTALQTRRKEMPLGLIPTIAKFLYKKD